MWDTILALPAPAKDLVYPNAIWLYAKGMANSGKNDIEKAEKNLDDLNLLAKDTILQHLTIWDINTTSDIVQIAARVLAAEIAAKKNDLDKSITLLNEAVAIEDNLNYNEPPDWFFSVRHYLGAVLLKAGKFKEAENVYNKDLEKWRKNGWALTGLYNALKMQNKNDAALKVKSSFDQAWQYADVKLVSSAGLTE